MADESNSDPEAPTQPERPLAELMRGVPAAAPPIAVGPPTVPAPVEAPRDGRAEAPTTANGPSAAGERGAAERVEGAFEWAKWAGVELSSFERAFAVFRRVGLLRGSAILFALVLPTIKLVWLPSLVERGVGTIVEGYGLEVEAREWSTDLLGDLAVEARGLVLRAPGPYGQEELLEIEHARVDLSLWGRLRRGTWVHDVSLDGGEVYLEQLLSGRWNVSEVFDGPELRSQVHSFDERFEQRAADRDDGAERVTAPPGPSRRSCRWYGFACLDRVRVRDVSLEWVENWPGQSGDGLVHTSRATLHIDDLEGTVHDLRLPLDRRERPSRFSFEGRVGDGRFSVAGDGNFFWWTAKDALDVVPPARREPLRQPQTTEAASGAPPSVAGPRARQVQWQPQGSAQLYLENVRAAVVGKLVPPAAIRPVGGTVSGTIEIQFGDGGHRGDGSVELDGVQYAVNRDSPLLGERADDIERSLDGLVVDGSVPVSFGSGADTPAARPVAIAQSSVTAAALGSAPAPVVAVARADQMRFSEALAGDGAELLRRELAGLVGEEAAAELSALAAEAALEDGAAGEGEGGPAAAARRLGRGVKRLFTRDRNSG